MRAVVLLLSACTGRPEATPPPAPSWLGGSVAALPAEDGSVTLLDAAWRSDTPLLSPGRVPADATVAIRHLDDSGKPVWETILVEGERARPLDIAAVADGGFAALVVRPGTPPEVGLIPVSATGIAGRFVAMGDAVNVHPKVLHTDASGGLLVAGSTVVPIETGSTSTPAPEFEGAAGFIGRLGPDLSLASVEFWDEPGAQTVTALASDATGVTWVGTSRERRGAPGTTMLGSLEGGPPSPLEGLVEVRSVARILGNTIVAGWAAEGSGIRGLPGSTPLIPRLQAIGTDHAVRWTTDGCCATWNHDLDIHLDGDTLLLGGRADAATLRLGAREVPGGAGVQAVSARLDAATGVVQELHGLGQVGDTPLDLPVSVVPGACVVAGSGTPPLCPGAAPAGG